MNVVFLDRDGVINKYPGHGDYVKRVQDFHLLPDVLNAIAKLNEAKFKVFVISNQACVGRGIITQKKLDQITQKLLKAASLNDVRIHGIFYCTHKPDENCECRKPKIGNIKKALSSIKSKLELVNNGYFVGDTDKDIEAGHAAGLQTILVESGRDRFADLKRLKIRPNFVAKDLTSAVDIILNNENTRHTRNRGRRA